MGEWPVNQVGLGCEGVDGWENKQGLSTSSNVVYKLCHIFYLKKTTWEAIINNF